MAKDPAAVSLGRRGGLKGGKARASSLTLDRRVEIAKKASAARWDRPARASLCQMEGAVSDNRKRAKKRPMRRADECLSLTPEMIDAGFRVLAWRYDPDADDALCRQVVTEMYTAMMMARSAGL